MSQLVRYGVRQGDSIVFVDTAWLVCATHSPNVCNSQRGASWVRANVLSRYKNGDVMVLWIIIFLRIQRSLPSEFLERRNTTEREREKVKRFQCYANRRTLDDCFRLPAETFQRRCCHLGHIQLLIRIVVFKQNDLDDNNVHGISNRRVFVERRNHVHNRQ